MCEYKEIGISWSHLSHMQNTLTLPKDLQKSYYSIISKSALLLSNSDEVSFSTARQVQFPVVGQLFHSVFQA